MIVVRIGLRLKLVRVGLGLVFTVLLNNYVKVRVSQGWLSLCVNTSFHGHMGASAQFCFAEMNINNYISLFPQPVPSVSLNKQTFSRNKISLLKQIFLKQPNNWISPGEQIFSQNINRFSLSLSLSLSLFLSLPGARDV